MIKSLINFIAFQAAWFACVLGAARGWWWQAPLAAQIAVSIHLAMSKRRSNEGALLCVAIAIGLVTDLFMIKVGCIALQQTSSLALAALWFASLWAAFATTLNSSLSWMRGKPVLALVLGAIGGPLAYFGGQKLGAVTLPREGFSILAIGIEWAIIMPLLTWMSERLLPKEVRP